MFSPSPPPRPDPDDDDDDDQGGEDGDDVDGDGGEATHFCGDATSDDGAGRIEFNSTVFDGLMLTGDAGYGSDSSHDSMPDLASGTDSDSGGA